MKLSEAAVGTKVKILSVNFPPELQGRILGLGFVPGAIVEVVREAPFGDPRVYMVHGKMITLRKSEADLIEVKPLSRQFPLSMAEVGKRYIIKSFLGGPFFISRVRSMGIDIGNIIEVRSKFPMTVVVSGKVVRIGMGMAEKILVEEI